MFFGRPEKKETRLNVESRSIKMELYSLESVLDKRNEVMMCRIERSTRDEELG